MSDVQVIVWSIIMSGLIGAAIWGYLEVRSINHHLDVILTSLNERVHDLNDRLKVLEKKV